MKAYLPIVLLLLIVLSSCQKELSTETNTSNGTSTNDSNYLDKAITLYDFSGFPADSSVDTYSYDSRKRVVQLKTVYYPGSGSPTDSSEIAFYYNGTDSLPNKFILQGVEFGNSTYSDVHFPIYDAQGRLVLDSSIESYNHAPTTTIIKTITKRAYKTGYVVFTQKDSAIAIAPGSSVNSYTVDTGWTDANQNIIKNNNWEEGYSTPFISNKGNYTYDNKPSPYTRLNIFNLFYNIHSIKETLYPQYNNIVSYYNEDYGYGSPPIIYSISFTNTYNSQGLIIKATGTDNYGDPTRKYFLYKKL